MTYSSMSLRKQAPSFGQLAVPKIAAAFIFEGSFTEAEGGRGVPMQQV